MPEDQIKITLGDPAVRTNQVVDETNLDDHSNDNVDTSKDQNLNTPTITDETVDFDGVVYKLNTNGEAVDDAGKVVKTKDEVLAIKPVEKVIPPATKVSIDDKDYTIDENGNAINENNEIVYTKDQIDKMSDETPAGELDVPTLIKEVGIPIYDSEGNEVVYENTTKGLSNYIVDLRDTSREEGIIDFQNQLVNKFPVINDVITHLELYGNMKDFSETPDYSKVTLDKDNTNQLESIIIQGRTLRGETPEQAREFVEFKKAGKALYEAASSELESITKYYDQVKQTKEQQLTEKRNAEAKQVEDYWGVKVTKEGKLQPVNKVGSVYDTLAKGTVKIGDDTYTIPDKIRYERGGKVEFATRQDFFNYLYIPREINTPEGKVTMTAYDYDLAVQNQSRTIGNDIIDALKVFTGGDLSQIIKQAIKENKVAEIRKLRTVNSDASKTGDHSAEKKIILKRT
jgi:hypothetical protein